MATRSITHNEPPAAEIKKAIEKQKSLVEFARRLSRRLVLKGWTQAELAQRMRALAEERKLPLRLGADSISHYVNARYLPNPATLKLMAEVLDTDIVEMLPTNGVPEAGEELPPIGIQDLDDGTVWMRVNQAVPWPIAVKILALLRGEEDNRETK